MSKMIEDMNFIHSEFMTKQQSKISDFSTTMSNKLIAQDTELMDWNSNTVKELRTSQQQINEFLTQNLRRNIEKTGLFYSSL